MQAKFAIQRIDRVVEFTGEDEHTDVEDMGEIEPADFREALDALESDCWDNIDQRATEVILYPADWHQDMHTGVYESTQIVITARRADWLTRLLDVYEARKSR